jgi:DNA-binding beta-propeller fold protein YncE
MHHTTEKGTPMNQCDHAPKVPSFATGLSVSPRALLCRRGSGALARARRLALAALCVVCLLGTLTASPALAVRVHVFGGAWGWGVLNGKEELQRCTTTCQPGRAGSGDGQLSEPEGIAVDEATGDVYVLDQGNDRVEFFSAAGGFVGQFNGSGKFANEEGKEAPEPIFIGEAATNDGGIAVDNDSASPSFGDVYVSTGEGDQMAVDKFSATGAFIGQIVLPPRSDDIASGEITGIAVDPRGGLWVADQPVPVTGHEFVDNFSNAVANEYLESRVLHPASQFFDGGLAVDGADDLYLNVSDEFAVEFNAKGELLSSRNQETNDEVGEVRGVVSHGLGVEMSSGDVYLDDGTSLLRLGPGGSPQIEQVGGGHLTVANRCSTSYGKCGGGIAVSSATGRVYVVVGPANEVQEYVLEPPAVPLVEDDSVSGVTSGSATLGAVVNPRSEPDEEATSYRFEYTTEEQFLREGFTGAASVLGRLAPAYEPDSVSAHPQDLRPGTVYRFRVVAENSHENEKHEKTVYGEERAFTTQTPGPFVLPDGRGWELVSPADKLGALLFPINDNSILGASPIQAAAGGGGLTYTASAPTEPGPAGNTQIEVQVLSLRGSDGWSSRDLTLPHARATSLVEHPEFPFFSEDLSLAAVQPLGPFIPCRSAEGAKQPCISEEASEQTPYLRTNYLHDSTAEACTESCYRPLVSGAEGFANVPEPGTEFGINEGGVILSEHCPPEPVCGPQFESASPNLEHVVVRSRAALTGGFGGLFEWSGGRLTFVGEGTVGAGSQRVLSNDLAVGSHAVSADGSRVVFSGTSEGHSGLLLRDTETEETVTLAAGALFLTASADDSRVFFSNGGVLEECEIVDNEEGKLQCNKDGKPLDLSAGEKVFAPILGASEDGSHVYFVSNGVLTGEEANGRGEKAVHGTCKGERQEYEPPGALCNLYVSEDGVTRFVAVVSSADGEDSSGQLAEGLLVSTARVSPDGRWLAFLSDRSLTGYDNEQVAEGECKQREDDVHFAETGACREVYLYDAATSKLVCASCNPTGARPEGPSIVPGWTTPFYQSRYLSDGGRLFFDSSDALVPQATNGAQDVYEYEPPAGGEESPPDDSCTTAATTYSPASGGCVDLVSSGTSTEPSYFLDASESGDDVFFVTAAQLSKRDTDTSYDVYDARVGGSEPEEVKPVECQGDACQAPVSPPEDLTPGSLTFSGPGNVLYTPPVVGKPKARALTEAQKLTAALRVCHAKKNRRVRAACERKARRTYGAAKRATVKKSSYDRRAK